VKTIIAYLPTWIFFWLGHFISKILEISFFEKYEWWGNLFYPPYSRLMLWSVWWNDYGGLSVWGKE